ncbi:serine protease [Dyella sp. OK004]|uniref:S8 family serine peptidase n=1 Tax=Dyella sp. OK004 TaxID=1855292 RepID=UPI0008EBB6EF|nr:S8 family serine peptidase [Dyella sp. OK004]SFS14532.1 serine protease [Dyella sp. OK004]
MKSRPTFCISALAVALTMAMPVAHTADALPLMAPKLSVTTPTQESYSRFIISYRDGSAERGNRNAVLQNVKAAVARSGLDRATRSASGAIIAPLSATYQRKLGTGAELVSTSRKLDQREANALMQQIAADPAVAHVEPDVMMQAVRDITPSSDTAPQVFTPDDPYYAKYQWHFNNATGGANVSKAWDLADGDGVTVAVLDTGITNHPDIDLSLADAGYDFISDAAISGRATDDRVPGGWDLGDWTTAGQCGAGSTESKSSWHGTHVSGTVAELTNNGVGMAGVAHKAKVLPVRVLGHCGGYVSDIVDAIVWASGGHVDGVPDNANPAQVINMSLGASGACAADSVTGTAISSAIGRGTTVVAAAGNSNSNVASFTPAGCPGVIAVASNGITGKRAFYSNYGAGIAISAPGGGVYTNDDPNTGTQADPEGFVWSAINAGSTIPNVPAYGSSAGTSQASPHVAGVVAMILSATQQAGMAPPTPGQVRTILASSARPFPVAVDQPVGAGIVDAYAAVNKALGRGNGAEIVRLLTRNVILGKQTGGTGASILYAIKVPAGATTLNIRTVGGSGDVSLFVRVGNTPSYDGGNADFKSVKPGNNEAVVVAQPKAATYYIRVLGEQAFDNVSVLATYKP